MDIVRRAKLPVGSCLLAIPSVPCFEYWLLLHFEYTTQPFASSGKKSVCDTVIKALEKHMPTYEKGQKNVFHKTHEYLEDAVRRAQQIEVFHKTSGTDNPSTNVHKLVDYLRNLTS